MHYYKFNISDYTSHTSHLSLMEDLAFRKMMDWSYLHEQPLPLDIEEIAKRILMRSHTECIAYVLVEFFEETENGFVNNRIKKEVTLFNSKSESARKSALTRWNKNGKKAAKKQKKPVVNIKAKPSEEDVSCERITDALQTDCKGNAKQETLNTKQETITKDQDTPETCEQVTNIEPEKIVKPVEPKTEKQLSKAAELNNQAIDVFNYWKTVMRKSRVKIENSPERLTAIKSMIRKGYTVETIKQAVDGCKSTPWNMGDNPKGKNYNDLTLICRNSSKLDSFLPENNNIKTENQTGTPNTDTPGWENDVNWEF